MVHRRPSFSALVFGLSLAVPGAACSSGDVANGSFGAATSGLAPDTDDGGDGSTDGVDGSAGGDDAGARAGLGAAGFAAAGGRADSPNYSVVFSVGQSSVPTSSHSSPSYTLRGGLVGANGNPPQ